MNTITFTDNDAIEELSKAILAFKHHYLAAEAHRSMVTTSKNAKYRRLSPCNKGHYRAVAKHMPDTLNWMHQISFNWDIGDIGSIGEQTLPDVSWWVLGSAREDHQ
jgi:hypothetical protein